MDYVSATLVLVSVIYVISRFKARQKTTLPGMKCSQIGIFYAYTKSMYRQSTDAVPFLCLFHNLLSGCCKMFSRQKIFQLPLLFKHVVFLFKAETVEKILRSTEHIDKSKEYKFMEPFFGDSLLTSGGEKWKKRRKLLTPSFHFNILEEFLPVFHEQSVVLADTLEEASQLPWVDIKTIMNFCTLSIICRTAMGIQIDAKSIGFIEYREAIEELEVIFFHRIFRPWLYLDWMFYLSATGRRCKRNIKIVHGFVEKVLKEKKSQIEEASRRSSTVLDTVNLSHTKKNRSFLDLMFKHSLQNPSFTEDDIKNDLTFFMHAGHSPSSTTLSFCLYLVGLHESVQTKIHEELDDIFQGDVTREITKCDILEMKYLESVIKESMRLYTPVPFFLRELKEDIEILNHQVRSGTTCFIFPYMLHRDPEYFPDPEKFIPERFFSKISTGRHPYAYIPFSAGPRNCIGQIFALKEMKVVLANVLRRLHVTSLDPRDKVNMMSRINLTTDKPLRLKFRLR